MSGRPRCWQVATGLSVLLLGLVLASAAGAAPGDQAPSAVPTPTGTPTGRPTATGTPPAGVTAAAPTTATTTPTPAGSATPSLQGPTSLQVRSSGPQPGMYTLGWTSAASMTVMEFRVETMPAGGTPEVLARVPGNQNSAIVRADPSIGYALAVVAVDPSNRVSAPSNVVNTAGAPTATPIPPPPTPSGQVPYGYGAVPGTVVPGPYTAGAAAVPYAGAYGGASYGGAYPGAAYGSAPAPYGAPGYSTPYYKPVPYPGPPSYPAPPGYPGAVGAGAAQWWCTPLGGTTVVPVGQTRPPTGYTNCTYHP